MCLYLFVEAETVALMGLVLSIVVLNTDKTYVEHRVQHF